MSFVIHCTTSECLIFVDFFVDNFLICIAGIASLGAQFAKLRKGLKHLNFSKTSVSPKGTSSNLSHYLTVFNKMSITVYCRSTSVNVTVFHHYSIYVQVRQQVTIKRSALVTV